mmetsp:Transcript_13017/g.27567  ORF Transcript_13017/g.27567 Transcript_13017/m.27567 type:complete len:140 (+) Transcript_13017:119-538(+)
MSNARSSSFCVYATLVILGHIVVTASAAGFSPGGDAFGLGRLPLPILPNRPGSRGRLAETMSEALDELRETRVELTALREEMKSIQQARRRNMKTAPVSDASSAEGDDNDHDVAEAPASSGPPAPIERSVPYGLGLSPA